MTVHSVSTSIGLPVAKEELLEWLGTIPEGTRVSGAHSVHDRGYSNDYTLKASWSKIVGGDN